MRRIISITNLFPHSFSSHFLTFYCFSTLVTLAAARGLFDFFSPRTFSILELSCNWLVQKPANRRDCILLHWVEILKISLLAVICRRGIGCSEKKTSFLNALYLIAKMKLLDVWEKVDEVGEVDVVRRDVHVNNLDRGRSWNGLLSAFHGGGTFKRQHLICVGCD